MYDDIIGNDKMSSKNPLVRQLAKEFRKYIKKNGYPGGSNSAKDVQERIAFNKYWYQQAHKRGIYFHVFAHRFQTKRPPWYSDNLHEDDKKETLVDKIVRDATK
jgi:hypothetical protein